jgi:EmrB/QacA subfamily drug resistance transporter
MCESIIERITHMVSTNAKQQTVSVGWVLGITAVASLVVSLDQLVVATALQTIRIGLHASLPSLEWTVNAFSLSLATLLIPASQLGDRIGRKRTLIIGLALFAVASATCAISPNIGALIIARVVQGAGGALILPTALALLTGSVSPQRRGAVMGVFAAVMGLAVVCGPLVGGAVAQGLTWHWVFWINVPVIAVVIPLAAVKLKETTGNPERTDVLGILLVGASTFGIVWALVRSGTVGWGSGEVIGTLVGAAVLLAVFIGWELRAKAPMLPVRMFTIPAFAAGNLSALLLTASLFSTVFFFAQYLQIALGFTPLEAGLGFLPWAIPLFIVSPLAGRLQGRLGPRLLVSVGLTIQAAALVWLAIIANAHGDYSSDVPALVLSGVGVAMAMPAQQNAVMSSVPASAMGKAAGTYSTIRQLGGALGIAIAAAVFASHGSDRSPNSFATGFAAAVVAAALIAILGAISGLFAPGRVRDTAALATPPTSTVTEIGTK